MDEVPTCRVTEALQAWCRGDDGAADQLFPLVYGNLLRRAAFVLRSERPDHLLSPRALVSEAYLRLADRRLPYFENQMQFYAVSVRVMRQVLVDYARARDAGKRIHERRLLDLDDALPVLADRPRNLVALDDALHDLAVFDPIKARVVELRYFEGLTIRETAEVLGCSGSTVKRDWALARVWLSEQIGRL